MMESFKPLLTKKIMKKTGLLFSIDFSNDVSTDNIWTFDLKTAGDNLGVVLAGDNLGVVLAGDNLGVVLAGDNLGVVLAGDTLGMSGDSPSR